MTGRIGTPMHLVRVYTPCNHRWGQWKATGDTFGDSHDMWRRCPKCGKRQTKTFGPPPERTFTPGDGTCDRRHRWSGWTPGTHGGQTRQCWGCGATQSEGLTPDRHQV